MNKKNAIIALATTLFLLNIIYACKKEENPPSTTPYTFPEIPNFRAIPEDASNPLTIEGVELGKKLFFDPILSLDSSISCSSCHQPQFSFADNKIKSEGVHQVLGKRNSMVLVNLAWQKDRFFWDGRTTSLHEQIAFPIQDPLEMQNTLVEVENRLQKNPIYVDLFWKVFGTKNISIDLVGKAIEQYEKTLISYNSKFDKFSRGELMLTDSELRGLEIFKTEKGDCFHCHSSTAPEVFISPDRTFANNGMDTITNVIDFVDFGLGDFTNNLSDYGRFKIPTLRNLAFTAPYMHDGRFATLDEVIDFYNQGPKGSPTLEPIMREKAEKRLETLGHWGLNLSAQDKADLKAFLLTLSDSSFVQ